MVEVLIAILIATVIFTGLLTTLRAALAAYRRLDETSSEMHEVRLFTTLLEAELRNMIFYSEASFSGGTQQFRFPTLADEYEDDTIQKRPVLVNYEYREKSLYRKETTLRNLFTEKKETSKKIIPSLKSFSVKYAYRERENPEMTWLPAWSEGQGLPRGIQIMMTFEKKDRKRPGKTEDFSMTRKFFIPQGTWGLIQK